MLGTILLACAALIILSSTPAFADVMVCYQPPTLNGTLYPSQNDPDGFGNLATMYDDFVIFAQVPFYLNDVNWYGAYYSASYACENQASANTNQQFTVLGDSEGYRQS